MVKRTLIATIEVEVGDNLRDVLLAALTVGPPQKPPDPPPAPPAEEGPPTHQCLACGLMFDAFYHQNPEQACPACGSPDLMDLPATERRKGIILDKKKGFQAGEEKGPRG